MRAKLLVVLFIFIITTFVCADPFPKESAVYKNPQDAVRESFVISEKMSVAEIWREARDVLRVQVEWVQSSESYRLAATVIEKSGTEAVINRAVNKDDLGSYHGMLSDLATGQPMYYDALGTGMEYRILVRAMTFRFPVPDKAVEFTMTAENPQSGVMEEVLRKVIDPTSVPRVAIATDEVEREELEVRLLRAATQSPKLIVNVYAEGYQSHRREQFWQDAARVADRLVSNNFPMVANMEFRGVFASSNVPLGTAKNLGFPIPERDSFLGMYYPYWDDFGRWYHIVYPTREARYRAAIGKVPYDYPIGVVDSSSYWGVGNYKEHTVIPARNSSFTYLLLHEFGHYFGLNEEYESGGKTELAFAPGIKEPWSQNITFLDKAPEVKWEQTKGTPIPTPSHYWNGNGPYGAYRGGYAQTPPLGRSYKPGYNCVMSSGGKFCPVCTKAIKERVLFDLGQGK